MEYKYRYETHLPACECGLYVDGKLQLFRQQLDGICGAVSRRARRVSLSLGHVHSPCVLFPRPCGLLVRTRTSMDSIRWGLRCCSSCKALRDAQLNLSDPQKRILKGSGRYEGRHVVLYARHSGRRDPILTAVGNEDRVSRASSISHLGWADWSQRLMSWC